MEKISHTYGANRIFCLLTAGLVLVSAAGCSGKAKETAVSVPEEDMGVLVKVEKPKIGSLAMSTEYIATIEPDELVSVYPKASGRVLRINAQVGDAVKKGDLLFEIDPVDIESQLSAQQAGVDVARAAVETAQAQVDQQLGSSYDIKLAQLETQVESAKKNYSAARQGLRDYNDNTDVEGLEESLDKTTEGRRALESQLEASRQQLADCAAKTGAHADDTHGSGSDDWMNLQRQVSNLSSKLTSMEEMESMLQANYNEMDDGDSSTRRNLRTQVSNAQLAYDSANTIYELTKGSAYGDALKVSNASLKQATASFEAQVKSYEAASKQLTYTKVYAPIDGIVEERNVSEQEPVDSSDIAYTVSNKSTVMAIFYVPSDVVSQLSPGNRVTIENGSQTAVGSITEIGTMVDASSGLFKVKAMVENNTTLLTGLTVKVITDTAHAEKAVLIPQDSIYYEDGSPYVYIVNNSIAVKTPITVGITNNDEAEVLSGLTESSDLVVSWNPNLKDGATIRPVTDSNTSSSAQTPSSSIAESSLPSSDSITDSSIPSDSSGSIVDGAVKTDASSSVASAKTAAQEV